MLRSVWDVGSCLKHIDGLCFILRIAGSVIGMFRVGIWVLGELELRVLFSSSFDYVV